MSSARCCNPIPLRWKTLCPGEDCLIWQFACDSHGYGQINKDGRVQYVHRALCEAVNGPPPSKSHQAAHGCGKGNIGCVNPKHVRWATTAENAADKEVHGTLPFGEAHHWSLLTVDQVREIRSLRGRMTQQAIGDKFGVHKETVGCIQRRENWDWLD